MVRSGVGELLRSVRIGVCAGVPRGYVGVIFNGVGDGVTAAVAATVAAGLAVGAGESFGIGVGVGVVFSSFRTARAEFWERARVTRASVISKFFILMCLGGSLNQLKRIFLVSELDAAGFHLFGRVRFTRE